MDNDSSNPAAPARSGQATGYATAVEAAMVVSCANYEQTSREDLHSAQDAILADILDGRVLDEGEEISVEEAAAYRLVLEVRRLRAALERVNLLTTGNGANANPYETIVEAHRVSNDALAHNKPELSDGRTEGTR